MGNQKWRNAMQKMFETKNPRLQAHAARVTRTRREVMDLLKKISKDMIIDDVIRGTIGTKKPGEIHWRVLILDNVSSKIVSSCCGMHDITAEGVTLVEDLHKSREPLPFLEAIYILKPTQNDSIKALLRDLDSDPHIYRAFHIFFIELCPMDIIEKLAAVRNISRVKTFKEINISFIPYESHVFLIENNSRINQLYYNNDNASSAEVDEVFETMAGQIATLCACLGENPSIRYRSAFPKNSELAQMIDKKLQDYKKIEPTMGEGSDKCKSQLIILDRGFDCTSPILHELTFEAMVHDLLKIEDGAYTFKTSTGEEKRVFLDEDSSWQKLKHLHIADVSQNVAEEYKKFMDSKNVDAKSGDQQVGVRELQIMVKKLPQYQKEMTTFASQISMADDCLKVYKRIKDLCAVEQDLATGMNVDGEKIKDFMNKMNPILLDVDKENGYTDHEKLRLIILYIISKNGIPEDSLSKLLIHANVDPKLRDNVLNLALLGPNVVVTGGIKLKDIHLMERKNRDDQTTQRYTMSRWTPILKDICEFAIEDKLDKKNFPYQSNRGQGGYKPAISTRYGWTKGGNQVRNVPRLIIFVVGGISLSEIRSVYEVNQNQSEYEIVIGSNEVITPEKFIRNLETLR